MSTCSSPLFTPPSSPQSENDQGLAASPRAPDIDGLYYFPHFFDSTQCRKIVQDVIKADYFDMDAGIDQAVLFGRSGEALDSGLPEWCDRLLSLTYDLLRDKEIIPGKALDLLFPTSDHSVESAEMRQMILNCYEPGQGIAAHIDLPHKFGDGIMIFSFGSGITMDFLPTQAEDKREALYLMPGSLCILSEESRWEWKHGIHPRLGDWVVSEDGLENTYIARGKRLSVTVRWYNVNSGDAENNHDIQEGDSNARRTYEDRT